ncbi:uncharacterized protein LOC120540139 isoform X4 [Polypterus senegalus]|uniref:uncharacterized protein LOC120540139 isoform X4 n=1 Tax=Polypterus senegalus TaxID=55291 RepID=UPI001962A52A|nr:uncharacterized protein LOC120540139 isoform X4 [Polypterus senegalus]
MLFVKMTFLLFSLIQAADEKTNPPNNQSTSKSNDTHDSPTRPEGNKTSDGSVNTAGTSKSNTTDQQHWSMVTERTTSPAESGQNETSGDKASTHKPENLSSSPSSSQTLSTEKESQVTSAGNSGTNTMSGGAAVNTAGTSKSTTTDQQHWSMVTERTTSPTEPGKNETSGDKGKLWLQLLLFPVFGALGCVVCVTITACAANHFKRKQMKCEERREMLEINGEEQGVHTEDATALSTAMEVEEKKQEVDYAEIDYSKLGSKKEEGDNCKTEDETKAQPENTSEYSEVKFTGKEETPEPANQALPPPLTDNQANDQLPLVDTIIEASEQN